MSVVQKLLYGGDDRLRATVRVLPTVPLYIVCLFVAFAAFSALGASMESMSAYAARLGVVTALFLGVFLLWSDRVDKRSLQDYGIKFDGGLLTDFLAGFTVVVTAFALWAGLAVVTGAAEVTLTMSYDGGPFGLAAGLFIIGTVFGALHQDLLYLALILTNSVEGIESRLSSTPIALIGGTVVTATVFVGYHFLLGIGVAGFLPPAEAAITLVTSILFLVGVYLYSGSLAMAVGTHAAFNASQGFLFVREAGPLPTPTVFTVDGSLLPSVLGTPPVAETAIAAVLLLGGLRLVRGRREVEDTVSRFRVSAD